LLHAYDFSSEDEDCSMPNNGAESMPGWSDHASNLFTTTRPNLHSPPEAPRTGGKLLQILIITTLTQYRFPVHFGYQT
jgi:hypothetical protein